MRYAVIAALFSTIVGLFGLSYLWDINIAQAQESVAIDAGSPPDAGPYRASTSETGKTPAGPQVATDSSTVNTPDPLEQPSKAIEFLKDMWKLGIWPFIASVFLFLSRFIVRRMQPGASDPPLIGWRSKTLAIAAAVVAVSGPVLEVLLKTGSVMAVAAGIIYAYGLVKDAFNPPKGSALKTGA